jgi:DNA invertase Pin-like site-specific DNA recombinase
LVVHSLDRLARNLVDLRQLVDGLLECGVTVAFVKERLTFTGEDSAMSKLLLSVMGAFAEFERSLIRERQREGIAIAKAKGNVYKGRKPSLSAEDAKELRRRAANGENKTELAEEFGISRAALYVYLVAA